MGEVSFSSPASFLRLAKADVVAARHRRSARRLRVPGGRAGQRSPRGDPAAPRDHHRLRPAARLLPDESGDPEERGRRRRCRRARPRGVHRRRRRRRRESTTHPRTSGRSRWSRSRSSPRRHSSSVGAGSDSRKAALYGVCAGVLFGLSASLCKPTMEILGDDGVGGVVDELGGVRLRDHGRRRVRRPADLALEGQPRGVGRDRLGLQPARQHRHRDAAPRRAPRRADVAQGRGVSAGSASPSPAPR